MPSTHQREHPHTSHLGRLSGHRLIPSLVWNLNALGNFCPVFKQPRHRPGAHLLVRSSGNRPPDGESRPASPRPAAQSGGWLRPAPRWGRGGRSARASDAGSGWSPPRPAPWGAHRGSGPGSRPQSFSLRRPSCALPRAARPAGARLRGAPAPPRGAPAHARPRRPQPCGRTPRWVLSDHSEHSQGFLSAGVGKVTASRATGPQAP